MLGVPLLREGFPIGVIVVQRTSIRPFTEKQIELLTTFADQAAIAIENVRLFEAEQQRTRELGESLEQQTATSEVLRVISSSTGELEAVFQVILENAVRICEAKFGTLFLRDADAFRAVATHNAPPAYVEALAREPLIRPPPDVPLGRVAATRRAAHMADIRTAQSYIERHPFVFDAAELAGYRSVLSVPMLKENELVGAINILGQEVRPFTDKHIELVQNFANQAVIAIENTRLLNELRQRTDDLSESLEQQTATSEVLRVISSSPGDLEQVFSAMLQNATRICGAELGTLELWNDSGARLAASHGVPPAYIDFRKREPILRPPPEHPLAQAATTRQWFGRPHEAHSPNLLGRGPCWWSPCSRKSNLWVSSTFIVGKFDRSPTNRSSFCRTSPLRLSSPSRIRASSTSCASALTTLLNRWSSRPPRRRCLRSSAARRSISKRCLKL